MAKSELGLAEPDQDKEVEKPKLVQERENGNICKCVQMQSEVLEVHVLCAT